MDPPLVSDACVAAVEGNKEEWDREERKVRTRLSGSMWGSGGARGDEGVRWDQARVRIRWGRSWALEATGDWA